MRLIWSLGALGLTNILELFCLLGLSAYDKIIQFHSPFCIAAGLCHFFVCLNVAWWCGVFSGAPLLLLSILYIYYVFDVGVDILIFWGNSDATAHLLSVNSDENVNHDLSISTEVREAKQKLIISTIIWLQDIWLILSRLILIFADPTKPSFFGNLDHDEFDVLCFVSISTILILHCSVILYNPKN
jgi:hypothetical protein